MRPEIHNYLVNIEKLFKLSETSRVMRECMFCLVLSRQNRFTPQNIWERGFIIKLKNEVCLTFKPYRDGWFSHTISSDINISLLCRNIDTIQIFMNSFDEVKKPRVNCYKLFFPTLRHFLCHFHFLVFRTVYYSLWWTESCIGFC